MNATTIVHWPGKDTVACEAHAYKLRNLATFMGFAVSCTAAEEGLECDNCKNEAKTAEDKLK